MTAPPRPRMKANQKTIPSNAFIIRNGRLDPEWAKVERRTLGITGRAISTMISSAGLNDVVRIFSVTQRDGVGYNLAYIGSDFDVPLTQPFDPGYMRALYDYAYQRARRGYNWSKSPPLV